MAIKKTEWLNCTDDHHCAHKVHESPTYTYISSVTADVVGCWYTAHRKWTSSSHKVNLI